MPICFGLLYNVFVSLRTFFAVAQADPNPLPGEEWCGWRYAPHCLIAMLSSTLFTGGLFYILPVSLGVPLEYYFGDAVSFLLGFTVCVLFTAKVMQFFRKRDLQRGVVADREERDNVVADEDGVGEVAKKGGCFQEAVSELNVIAIASVAMGCWFLFHATSSPNLSLPCKASFHSSVTVAPQPAVHTHAYRPHGYTSNI